MRGLHHPSVMPSGSPSVGQCRCWGDWFPSQFGLVRARGRLGLVGR